MQWKKQKETICKSFAFANYMDAIAFVHQVAELAERINHHPVMLVSYGTVVVTLTTHDAGCVTDKDYQLAKMIDAL